MIDSKINKGISDINKSRETRCPYVNTEREEVVAFMPKLPKFTQNLGRFFERIHLTEKQWMLLAGAACVFFGLLLFIFSSGDSGNKQASHVDTVRVVVAKQDIPQRTIIKENMVRVVEMPVDVVPAGAAHDISEVTDQPTSVAIQQGDVLTDKKVFMDPKKAGFVGMIPPDCRAISVPITDITGIAGFAKPGDYVDVMIISGKADDKGISGEILLQNVLLLGINKTGLDSVENTVQDSGSNENSSGDKKKDAKAADTGKSSGQMATATLALTPEESLKLAVASQSGTVYLVLRPVDPTDIFTVDTDYFLLTNKGKDQPGAPATNYTPPANTSSSAPTHSNSYTPPAPAAPAAPAAAPSPAASAVQAISNGIEILRGTKSSEE